MRLPSRSSVLSKAAAIGDGAFARPSAKLRPEGDRLM
jgi:hypothetical protein